MENIKQRSLETIACSRCGGSGQFSYCQMYGTTCFKCHGKGKVFTKRGRVAAEYLKTLRSKAVKDLQPGDQIVAEGCPGLSASKWAVVVRVTRDEFGGNISSDGGRYCQLNAATVETVDWSHGGLPREALRRVRQTNASMFATFSRALEFQETLTKAGTVRKQKTAKI